MSKNFMVLLKAVVEYPYSKTFKVPDVYPGWDTLTDEEQKNLLREFAIFAWGVYFPANIEVEDLNHLSDFNFTYRKDLRGEMERGSFSQAVEVALTLKSLPSGREFTLPEMEREKGGFNSLMYTCPDTEKTLNHMIEKGCIPFLRKVGESYGFTIYKRL